jgi:hypothetical protein
VTGVGAPRAKRRRRPASADGIVDGLARKSVRLLEADGILDALGGGSRLAVVGPVARLGGEGPFVRLAFRVDDHGRLLVGYAASRDPGGPWSHAEGEFEPFTIRAHGYYQRYIKRLAPVD